MSSPGPIELALGAMAPPSALIEVSTVWLVFVVSDGVREHSKLYASEEEAGQACCDALHEFAKAQHIDISCEQARQVAEKSETVFYDESFPEWHNYLNVLVEEYALNVDAWVEELDLP